jgi:hypothetical protein
MKTATHPISRRRSILIHGLGIALRRFPAFLWTYIFSLVLAFLCSINLKLRLSAILDHSIAAQRLSNGFDISSVAETFLHLSEAPGGTGTASTGSLSVLLFFILYFILVPGTLFCYLTHTRARLGTLVRRGLFHFWRFVRITIVALIIFCLVLGPLSALERRWSDLIDDRMVGRPAFILTLVGACVVLLVASLLRLYFDLVEVYTVQLGTLLLPNGQPDRRVRRTFRPAFRTLRTNFFRAWLTFLLLFALGVAAMFFSARTVMHMLAQPRVWPMFLVAQAGLFLMLFTRFWQRGAEVSLVQQNPIPPLPALEEPVSIYRPAGVPTVLPAPAETQPVLTPDPIPNPEPAPPPLEQPDPGVFHHDPHRPQT